jgi:hypothetical protein
VELTNSFFCIVDLPSFRERTKTVQHVGVTIMFLMMCRVFENEVPARDLCEPKIFG